MRILGALLLLMTVGRVAPYNANWRTGLDGWHSTDRGWTAGGGTLSYSGSGRSVILAPVHPRSSTYTLQARIRLVAYRSSGVYRANSFGIFFLAASPGSGLGAGVLEIKDLNTGDTFPGAIVTDPYIPYLEPALGNNADFDPGHGWHTYRVQVRGNAIHLSIDGQDQVDVGQRHILKGLLQVRGRRVALGTGIGLFSMTSRIQVSGFQLIDGS